MRKLASAAVAVALAGVMAIPAPASAQSMTFSYGNQGRYVNNFCATHPRADRCDDFRHNGRHWKRSDYQNWYRYNQPSLGNIGAGIFGFAVGAAIANGIANSNNDRGYSSSHVARCEAAYRSYNPRTDSFLGYDGDYHRCNL